MLKNNSLKMSSLLNQNSNSLATNLIQELTNQFSLLNPKINDLKAFSLKISGNLLLMFDLFASLQSDNSHVSSSISSNFESLFNLLSANKNDMFNYFSDSLNLNLGKIFEDKISMFEDLNSIINTNSLELSSSINLCITTGLNKVNILLAENKNLTQSIFNWAFLNMNDESNPFVKLINIVSSLVHQSSSNIFQPLELINGYAIKIFEISLLTNSNYTLMSNRLIDFQSTFENKFIEFTTFFTSTFSNLHNNMNSQSELLSSFCNSLSALNANCQNLLISIGNMESTLHDSIDKSCLSLSYITSEKFIEKISTCFDLLLRADPLNMNDKMNKVLENLSAISTTLLNEKKIICRNC
jgi:hypothetical protein